jgi:hypothetical protein
VTQPTTTGSEGATHWELEASIDNATFYLAQSPILIATTHVDDTVPYSEGYSGTSGPNAFVFLLGGNGILSATSGDYTVPPSAQFLTVDDDRLVMAGSWTSNALKSRVSWTPVNGDPGSGNDERVPIASTNFLDLDAGEGGGITDMSQASNGFFYVFKWSKIYKMVRTGERSRAYEASVVSKTMGAIPGSVVSGLDEFGRSCVYALDPSLGPYRIGANGLQLHHGMGSVSNNESAWYYINLSASKLCCSVYYPDAQQVCWWVPSAGVTPFVAANTPNMKIVLQVDATRATDNGYGIEGGLSLADGPAANALCACLFADDVDNNGPYSRNLKPFTGVLNDAAGSFPFASIRIHDSDDADGTDDGVNFDAVIYTAPIMSAGFLNRFGVLSASTLVRPNGAQFVLGLARDFGNAEKVATIDTSGSENFEGIRTVDDMALADCRALQVTLSDPADRAQAGFRWKVIQIALSQSQQEKG